MLTHASLAAGTVRARLRRQLIDHRSFGAHCNRRTAASNRRVPAPARGQCALRIEHNAVFCKVTRSRSQAHLMRAPLRALTGSQNRTLCLAPPVRLRAQPRLAAALNRK